MKVTPMQSSGFYLRKKVAGSTLKIEGSIFGAKPGMRGAGIQESDSLSICLQNYM